jgi:hypothetical protein
MKDLAMLQFTDATFLPCRTIRGDNFFTPFLLLFYRHNIYLYLVFIISKPDKESFL